MFRNLVIAFLFAVVAVGCCDSKPTTKTEEKAKEKVACPACGKDKCDKECVEKCDCSSKCKK